MRRRFHSVIVYAILICYLASAEGLALASSRGQDCLAPESEAKKDSFRTVREVMDTALAEKGRSNGGNGLIASLAGAFGLLWPVVAGGILVAVSPLNAAQPASATAAVAAKGWSALGVAGVVLPLSLLVAAIVYAGWRYYRSIAEAEEQPLKQPRPPAAKMLPSLKPQLSGPVPVRSQKLWERLKQARPIAVFDQRIGLDKKITFELAEMYRDGKDPVSRQALARRKVTLNAVIEKVRKIEKWIAKEPAGNLVKQIVIVDDDDQFEIQVVKGPDVAVFSWKWLNNEGKLESSGLAHEIYHVAIPGYSPIEEVLVYSLEFVRMMNLWRDGKKDPVARALYERSISEIPNYGGVVEGRYFDEIILERMKDSLVENDGEGSMKLTSEDILYIAIPIVWEVMKKDLPRYIVLDPDRDHDEQLRELAELSKKTNADIRKEVLKMYEKNKQRLLRGRPLYSILLPIGLLDFACFAAPMTVILLAVKIGCIIYIFYEGTLVRRTAEIVQGMYESLSEGFAPPPVPVFQPIPITDRFSRPQQTVESSA